MTPALFTEETLRTFSCPDDRGQVFLWDSVVKGLGVRATPRGKRAFVFQRRVHGKTVRITIGRVDEFSITDARAKARELRHSFDCEVERSLLRGEVTAITDLGAGQAGTDAPTVGQLWPQYIEQGRPLRKFEWSQKSSFSPGYVAAMKWMAAPGGEARKRGSGQTQPGPLSSLMPLTINDLDDARLGAWFQAQNSRSPAQAARALMMLRGFLRWCAANPEQHMAAVQAMRAAKLLSPSTALPSRQRLESAIQLSELRAWWDAVLMLPNKMVSAYLRLLVLTGLHSQSLANLRWDDVELKWGRYVILTGHLYSRARVELNAELEGFFRSIPRGSGFIFSGDGVSGRMPDPRHGFKKSLQNAGLSPMPLSSLRRTFLLLAEAAGMPKESVAQYTHVGRYRRRRYTGRKRGTSVWVHVRNVESTLKRLVGRAVLFD